MITQDQFSDDRLQFSPLVGSDGVYRIELGDNSVYVDGFTESSHDQDTGSTWYRFGSDRTWVRVDDSKAVEAIMSELTC